MDWQTVRRNFPSRYVVVEALDAYTEGDQRIVPTLAVHGVFDQQYKEAWEFYKQIRDGRREFYIVHTSREILQIGILNPFNLAETD